MGVGGVSEQKCRKVILKQPPVSFVGPVTFVSFPNKKQEFDIAKSNSPLCVQGKAEKR